MRNMGCGTFAAVLVVGLFLSSRCGGDQQSPDLAVSEAVRVARIEDLVKSRLRDPASALFKHMDGGCGYVNSKNGFGGMTGDTPFIAGTNDKVVFRQDNPTAFDVVWQKHCIEGKT